MRHASLVCEGQHTSGAFLFQLPAFDGLPRNVAKVCEELRPCAALVRGNEGVLLRGGRAELPLPCQVLADKVGLCQSLVASPVIHDGRHRCGRKERNGGRSLALVKRGLLFCGTDSKARGFGHGIHKPFTTAAASGARAKTPCL